jgi:hypothetical protein
MRRSWTTRGCCAIVKKIPDVDIYNHGSISKGKGEKSAKQEPYLRRTPLLQVLLRKIKCQKHVPPLAEIKTVHKTLLDN